MNLTHYSVSDKLGAGTYGEVYKAHRKTGAREVVAIKCVKKSNLTKSEADAIVGEIALLKELKHEYIVEMKDFFWDSRFIYIVMEYCGGGDLSRYIKSHIQLPEHICQRFLQQLAAALKFLRSKNVAHMDLKPQNILLTHASKGHAPILKLADFGFAQKFSSEQMKHSLRGSPLYMAPEMVLDRRYDAKVDLWSVGVILYECLYGRAPYKSDTVNELMVKIREEKPIRIPPTVKLSDECHDLLSRCLQRDPCKRIDFDDFFSHRFLDLEHLPSVESHEKGMTLLQQAVKVDQEGELDEALLLYRSALEYLIPIVRSERNAAKKMSLRKKVDQYITRAEQINGQLNESSTRSEQFNKSSMIRAQQVNEHFNKNCSLPRSSSLDSQSTDELLNLSSNTPQMKTAVEIAQSGEMYELECKFDVAFEKYQTALGMLIPLLSAEPKGHRKTLLSSEVARWMARAETIKEIVQQSETDVADSIDKQCVIQ